MFSANLRVRFHFNHLFKDLLYLTLDLASDCYMKSCFTDKIFCRYSDFFIDIHMSSNTIYKMIFSNLLFFENSSNFSHIPT